MGERAVNWLIYTCLIGLIPVISRLFVWLSSQSGVEPLAISDIVAFGLVLHSSNIQEVNSRNNSDTRWKTVHNGISTLFLVLYSLILFTTISTSPNIDVNSIQRTTIMLSVISFIISLSIFYRSKIEGNVLGEGASANV